MADDIEAELAAAGKELDKVSQISKHTHTSTSLTVARMKRLTVRYYYPYAILLQ
jgi:hypothetical protein